jgi:hypothetical protein
VSEPLAISKDTKNSPRQARIIAEAIETDREPVADHLRQGGGRIVKGDPWDAETPRSFSTVRDMQSVIWNMKQCPI